MRKLYLLQIIISCILLSLLSLESTAQNDSRLFWSRKEATDMTLSQGRNWYPNHYLLFSLNTSAMRNYLLQSPAENSVSQRNSSYTLDLPMPDGRFHSYRMVESSVMEQGLADAFPEIKTYAGQGIDDPTATIRCDMTPLGFHAYIISTNGIVYIDPFSLDNANDYLVYFKADVPGGLFRFDCGLKTDLEKKQLNNSDDRLYEPSSVTSIGSQLRTYRLALAADGEYTVFYGGTVSKALAGMVTTMNRVNGIYERELGIHMNLVANDTVLIFTNPSSDPYSNSNGGAMLNQNQSTCDSRIGSANYDIGHVFSTGGGGIAGFEVVCDNSQKANGVTGSSSPVGDPFDVDYVAHEMGHQFGASHTFNATSSSCGGGNVDPSAAYEPGSASTIMGYAGICPPNDLQPNSDAYFHTKSFDEIVTFTQSGIGNTCPVTTSTGNNEPTITMPANYTIPYQTPFRLTASATDPDGDTLTYCWEEYDLGPQGSWNTPSGNAPIFRSFTATTSPTRLFPKLNNILSNTTSIGEIKASYARTLRFRCTARDNRSGGGGVTHNNTLVNVNVINTGTGFAITSTNTSGITWLGLTTQTVTWDIANTTAAPINTPNVNIYISEDNGQTFKDTIAMNVPNNGSYSFTVPDITTSIARIMVEGAGNIFFDINNRPFTITQSVNVPVVSDETKINIYPNPASGNFHFVFNSYSQGKCQITLHDITGRTVKEFSFNKSQSFMDLPLDLTGVASGMYLVKLQLPEGISERKLVVE